MNVANYGLSMISEIRRFFQNASQLNILLEETINSCKELKILQQSTVTSILYWINKNIFKSILKWLFFLFTSKY